MSRLSSLFGVAYSSVLACSDNVLGDSSPLGKASASMQHSSGVEVCGGDASPDISFAGLGGLSHAGGVAVAVARTNRTVVRTVSTPRSRPSSKGREGGRNACRMREHGADASPAARVLSPLILCVTRLHHSA